MKFRLHAVLALVAVVLAVAGCERQPVTQVERQRQQASHDAAAGQSYCYECDNILRRRLLFGKPGVIGYVVFLNPAGQPAMYSAVRGKCTSSGKRLDQPQAVMEVPQYDENGQRLTNLTSAHIVDAPSEDGTFGHSDNYIYCFTPDGRYLQWSGEYLYSDKPFDLTIKPLVIDMSARETAQ